MTEHQKTLVIFKTKERMGVGSGDGTSCNELKIFDLKCVTIFRSDRDGPARAGVELATRGPEVDPRSHFTSGTLLLYLLHRLRRGGRPYRDQFPGSEGCCGRRCPELCLERSLGSVRRSQLVQRRASSRA
jgi:hypothetical protein